MTQPLTRLPNPRGLSLLAAVCLLSSVCPVMAQSPSPSPSNTLRAGNPPPQATAVSAGPEVPKFEVATIKPSKSDNPRGPRMMQNTDGISFRGVPVNLMINESFGVEDDRVVGEPAWVKNRYDVEAKVDAEDAAKLENLTIDQRKAMLLPLLQDRFNLKYHHETRELPIYALVVAKGGVKMKPGAPDQPKPHVAMRGRGRIESTGTTNMLSHVLSRELERVVEDKTGLTGNYDYTLEYTPDDAGMPMGGGGGGDAAPGRGDRSPDVAGPSLFTALQEQLGLKLEATKSAVDVIVIDHIDLPSEN